MGIDGDGNKIDDMGNIIEGDFHTVQGTGRGAGIDKTKKDEATKQALLSYFQALQLKIDEGEGGKTSKSIVAFQKSATLKKILGDKEYPE